MGPTLSINVQRTQAGALITVVVGKKIEPEQLDQLAEVLTNQKVKPELPTQVLHQKLVIDEQAEALLKALGL